MQEFILFLLTFFFVFLLYEIFIVSRAKKNKKNGKSKDPLEVMYLVRRYKLDLEKVSYNQLLQLVAIISSFDIALIVTVVLHLKSLLLEIGVGLLITIVVIVVSYHLIYLFYKKKGMIQK